MVKNVFKKKLGLPLGPVTGILNLNGDKDSVLKK
jgi:hypothetical protein